MKWNVRLLLLFVFLLACVHGVKHIPFWSYWGLDFQNFHVFHHQCPEWPIPYLKSGGACGDPLGRAMIYPPALYWAMSWVRLVDFKTGFMLWEIITVLMTLTGVFLVWSQQSGKSKKDWFAFLPILFCLPMAYTLERGNVDAWVVLFGGISILFFGKKRYFLSGTFLAIAAWFKVYPAVPILLVLCTLLAQKNYRALFQFGTAVASTGVVLGLLTLPDSYLYVLQVLPRFSKEGGGGGYASHVLYSGWWSLFWKVPAIILWVRWAVQRISFDPLLVGSGFLAISTFFQRTANDYGLITAYPFLMLLVSRAIRKEETRSFFVLTLFTLFMFVGDRTLYELLGASRLHLQLFIAWFFVFPWYFLSNKNKTNPI